MNHSNLHFRLKCILKWCLILSLYIRIYIYVYTHNTWETNHLPGAPSSPFMFVFFPIQNSLKVLTKRTNFLPSSPPPFKDVVYRLGGQFWPSRCFMKLEGDPNGGKNVEKHGAQKRPKKQQKPRENKGLRWNLGQDFLWKKCLTQKWCFWWLKWFKKNGEVDMDGFFWRTSGTNRFQLSQVELLEICFFYTSDARHDPKATFGCFQK